MSQWGSHSIQIVWFASTVDGVKADALYDAITGEEPEHVQRNKVPNPGMPFFSVAAGTKDSIEYRFQVQPGRIDAVINASASNDEDAEMQLLDLETTLQEFLARFAAKADLWPNVVRLAIVGNLARPEDSMEAAVAEFFEMTNFDVGLDQVSDPIFQLNRRKSLPVGVDINRIMRFATGTLQHFIVRLDGQSEGVQPPMVAQIYTSALTLDYNTVPDGRVFSVEEQVPILNAIAAEVIKASNIRNPSALKD